LKKKLTKSKIKQKSINCLTKKRVETIIQQADAQTIAKYTLVQAGKIQEIAKGIDELKKSVDNFLSEIDELAKYYRDPITGQIIYN
jgi:uncharacterized coiled-coil DUF342 family protein